MVGTGNIDGKVKNPDGELPPRLRKRWLGYAAAAGAALASSGPVAQASIIYTPENVYLAPDDSATIPLAAGNSLTLLDFHTFDPISGGWARQNAVFASGMVAIDFSAGSKSHGIPTAVFGPGERIGPGAVFNPTAVLMATRSWPSVVEREGYFYGHGYLGLQLDINGQMHYGWAAATVGWTHLGGWSSDPWFGNQGFTVNLTGYAYNTVPGQPIEAGQTSAVPEPGTLGLLALGSLGLGYWRRRKTVGSQQ